MAVSDVIVYWPNSKLNDVNAMSHDIHACPSNVILCACEVMACPYIRSKYLKCDQYEEGVS